MMALTNVIKNQNNLIKKAFNGSIGSIWQTPTKIQTKKYKNKLYYNLIKHVFLNPFDDFDKDGVMNIFDCRPFNKRLQHVKPNKLQMERLRNSPIYITSAPISCEHGPKNYCHITAKDSPKEAKQRVYSVIKRYPQLLSEIQRRKPIGVFFTEKGISEKGKRSQTYGISHRRAVAVRTMDIQKNRLEGTKEVAKTTIHELKHTSQYTQNQNKPNQYKKLFKGKYETQKGEIAARKEEKKLEYSRPDINTKILQRKMEEDKRKKTIEYQGKEYSKEQIKQELAKYKQERQERGEAGFRRLFK